MFQAIVLGDKSSLEDETKLRYQMGGIVHIMAITGVLVFESQYVRFLKPA